MVEQNERIAVMETKIENIENKVEQIADMQLTLDAVVRQSRKQSELLESDEFIRDMVWIRKSRRDNESINARIKQAVIGAAVPAGLAALWYGIMHYIKKGS